MKNKRILIVDDEPNVRLGYRITLEAEGYDICEADGAKEAFEAFQVSDFNLAILDLRMPEKDGLVLLEEMRKLGIIVPVIIITAYGSVPNAVRAMKLGAIDFLEKPLTPELLRCIVKEVVERHATAPEDAGKDVSRRLERDDFRTHLYTAKRLINLRDFNGAKEHLIRALELNCDSAEAYNLAGVFYEMREDYERARKYYGQAIKVDKKFPPAQQNMRRLFELFNFGSSKEPFSLGE